MVWAKLWLARLAVVPYHPYLGAAVVILVADPAAAAVVVLVAKDQAVAVRVNIVIASHDLAARCLFGHEVDLCANHRSLPSRMAGELQAAGRRLAGRADHDARTPPPSCTAIMSGRSPFAQSHSAPGTGFVHGSVAEMQRDTLRRGRRRRQGKTSSRRSAEVDAMTGDCPTRRR